MKRPAFQFYPADWRSNANLRRCSEAARGAWMDVLCVLHDADEYGVVRYPLAELARAAGVPAKLLRELADKSVLKGADRQAADYVWAPTHAGKQGTPVRLVVAGEGPCWYSSRFVRDEYVRQRRGATTRFSEDNPPPKARPKGEPSEPPNPEPKGGFGAWQGDGASSSSSSTNLSGEALPTHAHARALSGAFEGHPEPDEPHPPAKPTPAARCAIALTAAGFRCTPLNPELLAYVEAGGTPEHLAALAAFPECQGKKAGYVLAFARRELAEPAAVITPAPARALTVGAPRSLPASKTAGALLDLEAKRHG